MQIWFSWRMLVLSILTWLVSFIKNLSTKEFISSGLIDFSLNS
jgi:hypothetical protein